MGDIQNCTFTNSVGLETNRSRSTFYCIKKSSKQNLILYGKRISRCKQNMCFRIEWSGEPYSLPAICMNYILLTNAPLIKLAITTATSLNYHL